ncbi:MAG: hypothetical protein WKG07_09005 [Hymenobacter sp.]
MLAGPVHLDERRVEGARRGRPAAGAPAGGGVSGVWCCTATARPAALGGLPIDPGGVGGGAC